MEERFFHIPAQCSFSNDAKHRLSSLGSYLLQVDEELPSGGWPPPLSPSCLLQLSRHRLEGLPSTLEVKNGRPRHPLGVARFQERKLQKERTVWERNVP